MSRKITSSYGDISISFTCFQMNLHQHVYTADRDRDSDTYYSNQFTKVINHNLSHFIT